MVLLEHDAKTLLTQFDITTPRGRLVDANAPASAWNLPPAPWVVKGQIKAGGRGKAGLVRKAATLDEARSVVDAMLGIVVKGMRVDSVRIEEQIGNVDEVYVGILVDPSAAGVRVIVSEQGGVEIESIAHDDIRAETVGLDATAIAACLERLSVTMAPHIAAAVRDAAPKLARLFVEREALLVEINPLFVRKDGTWMAADAKIVTDDNALDRQPELRQLLADREAAYPETALKQAHGFDYVVVDPDGDVGLLTTGAGLSMMLIDDMRAAGLRPFNFLDIRTGGFRGDPSRLITVLRWFGEASRIRVVLINIFAGITDLGEFSRLLVQALNDAPALKVPVVARLVGNGLPAAAAIFAEAGIALHTDLDAALDDVRKHLAPC